MKVVIYIDSKQKTILEVFSGDIYLENLSDAIPHLQNHVDYCPEYDRIIDLRDCSFKFSKKEVYILMNRIRNDENVMQGRAAILVSKPSIAAYAAIFEDKMKATNAVGVFCSNSEVIRFLNIAPTIFEKLDDPTAFTLSY